MDKIQAPDQKTRINSELFINGKWVEGAGQATFSAMNPFDNSELCKQLAWPTIWSTDWRAMFWSNDIRESHRIAQELEAGNVFLNAYGYQSEIPFGGDKMSGIGREHGTEAMHEYTQLKSVTVAMERFKSRFDI
jgi:acyl-CoA reductase-like NAD-dependent aldehyde dehydrogenase